VINIIIPLTAGVITLALGLWSFCTAEYGTPEGSGRKLDGIFLVGLSLIIWIGLPSAGDRYIDNERHEALVQRLEVLDNNINVYGSMTKEIHDSYTRLNNLLKGGKDGSKEDSNKVKKAESVRGLGNEGR
tara:strand:- start:419 stop:808 length:390 start_codon:yes stop_codon:yes gene_type:complete